MEAGHAANGGPPARPEALPLPFFALFLLSVLAACAHGPPVGPVPVTGRLRVFVDPPEATLTLDQRPPVLRADAASSALTFVVPVGMYTLVAAAPGRRAIRTRVRVSTDTSAIHLRLPPLLEVSDSPGAPRASFAGDSP